MTSGLVFFFVCLFLLGFFVCLFVFVFWVWLCGEPCVLQSRVRFDRWCAERQGHSGG